MKSNDTWIRVDGINRSGNRIKIAFSCSKNLGVYFLNSRCHWCEYDFNVEDIPESICVIPFLANVFPIVFLKNASVFVNEIEKSFYESLFKYFNAYSAIFGKKCQLDIKAQKIINVIKQKNFYDEKGCLLFSGGVDAINTLISQKNSICDCYFVHGADFELSNNDGFNKSFENNSKICTFFKKKLYPIKTNFKEYYNERKLDKEVAFVDKNGWWHGYQHGIALLGSLAPAIYYRGYNKVFIASSFTYDYDPVCASNPRFDTCFSVCKCKTIHDGFEFDRCQKIENIFNYLHENPFSLTIHVCWKTQTGDNCGQCEKCIRTYLNCVCTNNNPENIGIKPSIPYKKIRRYFYLQSGSTDVIFNRISVLNKAIDRTFIKPPRKLRWIKKCANFNYFLKRRKKEILKKKVKMFVLVFLEKRNKKVE